MITAEALQTLTTFTAPALSRATGGAFTNATFLGMTNGNQFCYSVTHDPDARGSEKSKVFITYDPTQGSVIATIG